MNVTRIIFTAFVVYTAAGILGELHFRGAL